MDTLAPAKFAVQSSPLLEHPRLIIQNSSWLEIQQGVRQQHVHIKFYPLTSMKPLLIQYSKIEVLQLLAGSPSGRLWTLWACLTSSFALFGRTGRVTHAYVSMMHVSLILIVVSMVYVSMMNVSTIYVKVTLDSIRNSFKMKILKTYALPALEGTS